jgi:biopolymer transport protein ExbD
MIDDILGGRKKRPIRDLNIVPILDMLTTIIFFLLLSAAFTEFTKVTIPPAAVSTTHDPKAEEPLSPKLMAETAGEGLNVKLMWTGKSPGSFHDTVKSAPGENPEVRRQNVIAQTGELMKKFAAAHPGEKTLQVGLGERVAYQDMISVMDGARPVIPDLVMISYGEVSARMPGGR